jgi:hypothetical protein
MSDDDLRVQAALLDLQAHNHTKPGFQQPGGLTNQSTDIHVASVSDKGSDTCSRCWSERMHSSAMVAAGISSLLKSAYLLQQYVPVPLAGRLAATHGQALQATR